jgi:two-component system, NtrC family, response regulator GlrR
MGPGRLDVLSQDDEHRAALDKLNRDVALAKLVGHDRAFLDVVRRIPVVAAASHPVLILGETGTGKELCARAVHYLSRRRRCQFIPVDCGALPDHLLENELFGHIRGAFTDAYRDQRGLVGMAKGGTLFLDEIDSLSPTAQGKLLRLLQDDTYKPLGADQFERADVRIVAASNARLERLVAAKSFRADLYFRLDVLSLRMPALRDRRSDIPRLAQHFVQHACAEAGVLLKRLESDAMALLTQASWPGNVRELQNVIQRAVVLAEESPAILPEHISMADEALLLDDAPTPDTPAADAFAPGPTEPQAPLNPAQPAPGGAEKGGFRAARARALEAFERSYVAQLLRAHNGNVTQSAREAQTDRRAFGRLMKRYRIDRRTV